MRMRQTLNAGGLPNGSQVCPVRPLAAALRFWLKAELLERHWVKPLSTCAATCATEANPSVYDDEPLSQTSRTVPDQSPHHQTDGGQPTLWLA